MTLQYKIEHDKAFDVEIQGMKIKTKKIIRYKCEEMMDSVNFR